MIDVVASLGKLDINALMGEMTEVTKSINVSPSYKRKRQPDALKLPSVCRVPGKTQPQGPIVRSCTLRFCQLVQVTRDT